MENKRGEVEVVLRTACGCTRLATVHNPTDVIRVVIRTRFVVQQLQDRHTADANIASGPYAIDVRKRTFRYYGDSHIGPDGLKRDLYEEELE